MQKERQESDAEHQENGDDAALDPIEDRNEVVAPRTLLTTKHISLCINLADRELLVKSSDEEHYNPSVRNARRMRNTQGLTGEHEHLNRVDDQDIVDVETRVSIVEGQEAIDGELRAKVVALPTEHLLTHTGTNLTLEVEDRAEAKITALSTLVVLRVLYTTTTPEGVHTGEDILVEMQTLLSL